MLFTNLTLITRCYILNSSIYNQARLCATAGLLRYILIGVSTQLLHKRLRVQYKILYTYYMCEKIMLNVGPAGGENHYRRTQG